MNSLLISLSAQLTDDLSTLRPSSNSESSIPSPPLLHPRLIPRLHPLLLHHQLHILITQTMNQDLLRIPQLMPNHTSKTHTTSCLRRLQNLTMTLNCIGSKMDVRGAQLDLSFLVSTTSKILNTITKVCLALPLLRTKLTRPLSDAGFFVFPDLSVRTEGSYRLKLSLFEVVGYVS